MYIIFYNYQHKEFLTESSYIKNTTGILSKYILLRFQEFNFLIFGCRVSQIPVPVGILQRLRAFGPFLL